MKRAAVEAGPVEEPWELPNGWRWERLANVTGEPDRGAPSSRFPETFAYLDVSGLDGQELTPRVVRSQDAPSRARQFVRAGDTVLSSVRVYLRNAALIADDGPDVASTAFCVIRPSEGLDPRYVFRWVSSDQFISRLLPLQRGNSPPAVLDADVRDQPIPVPPPEVQRRLLARIDELFAEIDDGERALSMASEAVENYRRALLKAVTTGSLIGGASGEANDPSDDLPLLPDGWRWTRLGDMATISGGITKNAKRSELPDTVAYLRVANVYAGRLDLSEVKRIGVSKSELSRFLLVSGDLLIVEGNGSIEQIGRSAIWDGSIEPCAHQNHLIKVRFAHPVFAEWIQAWLQSPHGRRELERQASSTSGLHTLSISKVEGLLCPSPPMGAVDGLVRQLAELRAQKQEAERQLAELAAAPMALRQSILAAAFRGDLVA